MSVLTRATWRNDPEDVILQSTCFLISLGISVRDNSTSAVTGQNPTLYSKTVKVFGTLGTIHRWETERSHGVGLHRKTQR
jgi:hypothetical protein